MTTFAKAADGSLVSQGKPHGNGALARLWRLPTAFLPVSAPALLIQGLPFLVWGTVLIGGAWLLKRARLLK